MPKDVLKDEFDKLNLKFSELDELKDKFAELD